MTVLFPTKPNILAVVELAGFTSHFRVLSLIRIIMGITDDTIYISNSCAVSRLTAIDLFSLYVSFPLSNHVIVFQKTVSFKFRLIHVHT